MAKMGDIVQTIRTIHDCVSEENFYKGRREAVKEFAVRLKQKYPLSNDIENEKLWHAINEVVKEMIS